MIVNPRAPVLPLNSRSIRRFVVKFISTLHMLYALTMMIRDHESTHIVRLRPYSGRAVLMGTLYSTLHQQVRHSRACAIPQQCFNLLIQQIIMNAIAAKKNAIPRQKRCLLHMDHWRLLISKHLRHAIAFVEILQLRFGQLTGIACLIDADRSRRSQGSMSLFSGCPCCKRRSQPRWTTRAASWEASCPSASAPFLDPMPSKMAASP